jgi:outer membrane protein TolC
MECVKELRCCSHYQKRFLKQVFIQPIQYSLLLGSVFLLALPQTAGAKTEQFSAPTKHFLSQLSQSSSTETPSLDLATPAIPTQRTYPLTLQQAIALALDQNLDLKTTRQEYDRAQAVVREAKAARYPTLSLNSGINQQFNREISNTFSAGIDLSYEIYTGGRRQRSIDIAKQQLQNSQLEIDRLVAQTRLQVALDYYDLQAAEEQIRIGQAAVNNASANLRDAEILLRVGSGTRLDVLRAQVNLANARQEYNGAIAQRNTAAIRLASRLNLAETITVQAIDPVTPAGDIPQTRPESLRLAYQHRPELQQQQLQRSITQLQKRQTLTQKLPTVALSTNLNTATTLENPSFSNEYAIGVQASWRIFDGGATRARTDQEDANVAIAETNFSKLLNQIRQEVEEAHTNLETNRESLQTASLGLTQARESRRLTQLQFQAGIGTQTEVITSENELVRAEVNYTRAILDYNRAWVSLGRAINRF